MSEAQEAPYLSIVIPCYNEEHRIGATIERVAAYLGGRSESTEVLVVDDGSMDRTSDVVREVAGDDATIRVVRVEKNRGKGGAVTHGFQQSRGSRVLFSDADLSTPVEDVERLERAMDAGADLAIGSRALPTSEVVVHQPWWRETMGKTFNLMVRAISWLPVRDSQCGFKLFDRERCAVLFQLRRVQGFAFDVELLTIARCHGLRWAEVPVRWYDNPESKVSPIVHSSQMFRDLLRIRFLELSGAYRGSNDGEGAGA